MAATASTGPAGGSPWVTVQSRKTVPPTSTVPVALYTSVGVVTPTRSEEHTSELQSRENLVCRLLLEKKKKKDREGASYFAPPSVLTRSSHRARRSTMA